MSAYYNEHDPHAAAWLRELIRRGLIAPGDVDERSILDVRADDLRLYRQCHFFAGIGGWSYALRLAGVSDDRPVWTGSCPCQPFSAAGAQRGSDDERHLWPAFFGLIRECRPATVIGEQVAGAAGLAWLDHVCADLEDAGYAAAAANLGAHSAGAPHMRQRLYWVAHAEHAVRRAVCERRHDGRDRANAGWTQAHGEPGACGEVRSVADADGRNASTEWEQRGWQQRQQPAHGGAGRMADADEQRPSRRGDAGGREEVGESRSQPAGTGADGSMGDAASAGFQAKRPTQPLSSKDEHLDCPWSDPDWLACTDGKARPTQRGIFPLAHGLSKSVVRSGDSGAPLDADATGEARVMRLRGYGNAIVPQVAAMFVRASMEVSA